MHYFVRSYKDCYGLRLDRAICHCGAKPIYTLRIRKVCSTLYVEVVMNPEENRCRVSREAQFPTSVLKYIHLDKPQEDRVYSVKGGLFNDGKLAWLSYGPRLDVVCMKTGLRRGYWRFGVPLPDCQTVVTCVIELPAGTASGRVRRLLVGLNSDVEGGRVCVFDFVSSKVLRAVAVPAPVSSMCVVDHGYEGTGSRYPLPRLVNSMSGIVSVGLVNGQLLLLDLCRMAYEEDLRNDSVLRDELNCSRLIPVSVNERDPNMVEKKRTMSARTGDHLCVLLSEPCCLEGVSQREARPQDDGMITCVQYVPSIASLLVGFNTGCFQIWSVMHMALEYTSPVLRGSSQAITHLAFQEASDDPKSYCYVWAVCEGDPMENCTALMYMLEYKSRDLVDGYGFLYMDFMQAYHVFELELSGNESENLNSHCLGCYTLTRNLPSKRDNGGNRDDGETETDLSLCMFSWECEGVVHLTLFDLNMWYKAQMPKSPSCLGPHTLSSFLGVQVLKDVLDTCTPKGPMLEVRVVAESVRRYKGIQALDEHFFPSALTFECVCLMERGGVSLSHTSTQLLLLSQLSKSGAATFLHPNDFFHRCNFAGLRPVLSDVSAMDSVSVSEQRNFLLSLALDKNLLGVLTRCINEWSDGCYSGQGCSFEMLLDWAWGRTVLVRQQIDELCKPLFDTTGLGLDSNWCRRLRHCGLLFKRLHIVFEAACAAKPPGVCDLTKRTEVLELLTMYVEVIQWFLGVGLLPEHPVDSEHTSYYTVPYPVTTIHAFYQRRREEMKALGLEAPLRSTAVSPGEDMLLIDGLVSHECGNSDRLSALWKVDGGSGLYPPPSIQSLLQTYLQTNTDMTVKHCIVIYVLLDLAFELHKDERYASALEKFVEFPTTFSMSPSVIKVAQAFWFLDHKEFEDALNLLSQVMVRPEDLRPWQHRAIIRAFLLQGHPEMAMSYITVRSPVVQDSQDVLLPSVPYKRVYFTGCILKNKLKTVISLQLSDLEEGHLMKFLDSLDSPRADDVEVFYYLKQERIIEALERNDLIKKRRMAQRGSNSLKRKRHQNYESTTRETWLRAYANTLPALTREITQHCLDKRDVFVNWQQVERPTPLSVNVCLGGLQPARCKSSLIHSALMKAKETWVKIPETPHTRHSIVQSTPFLCTPHTATYADGPEVPDVIPKLLSAPESTQDDDYNDETTTCARIDDPLRLLQSPHIRRSMGTQTSFTTPGRYLTGSSSDAPQSILKVTRLRGMSTTPEVFDTSDDEDEVPLSRRIRFSLPEEPTVDSSSPAGSPDAASPGGPTPRRNIHTGQERMQRIEDGMLCASKTTRFTDLERSQPLLSDISEEINSANNSEEDSSYFRRVSGRLSLLENKQSSPREELGSASKSEGNKSITGKVTAISPVLRKIPPTLLDVGVGLEPTSKLAEESSLIEKTKDKSKSEITTSTLDKMGEEPNLTDSSTESTSINRRIASRYSLSAFSATSKDITTSGDSHEISRNSSVVKNITRSSTSFLSSTLASVSTEDSSQGKSTSIDRIMTRSSSSIKTSFTSASFVEKESQALDAKKSNSTKRPTLSGRKSFRQSVLQESASATVSGSVSPTYDSLLTTPESTDNSNKRESQSSYITANSDTPPSVPTNLAPEVCVSLDTSSDDSDIDRFNSSFGTHHGGAASRNYANETIAGEGKNVPEAKENSVTQSLLTLDDFIEASTKNFVSQSVDNNLLNGPESAGIRSEGVNESDQGILLDDTSVGVALFSPQVIDDVIEDSADSKGTSNPTSRAPDKDELVITELVNAAPLQGFDENLSVDGRIDVKLSNDVAYPPFPSEELDYLDYYEAENSCDNDNFVDTSSALVDLCDSDQGSDGKEKEKGVENYFSLSDDNINDSESDESPLPSTWLSQEDRKPSQQASLNQSFQSNDSVVILDTDSDIDDWLDQQHLPSFAEVQKGIATKPKSLDSTKVDNKNEGATGAVSSMSQVEQEMSKDIGVNLLQFSQQSDDLVDALEAGKAIATVEIHSSDNESLDYGKTLDEVNKASLENSTDKANTTAGYSKKGDEKGIKEDSNVHAEDIFYDLSQTSTEISNSESKEAASLSNDFSKHAKANIDRFEKTDDKEKSSMSITGNVETNMSKVVSRTCNAEDTSAQVSDVPAVKVAEEGCKQVPPLIGDTVEESLKTCNENKSSLKQGEGSSLLKTKSRRRSSSTSVDKNGRAKSVKSRRSSSVEPDFVSASKVAGIQMETGDSLHNLPQNDEINVEVNTSRDEVESVLPLSSSKTPRASAEKLLSSSPVNVVNSLSKNVDDNSYSSDKVSNRLRSSYSNTTTTRKRLDNSGSVRGDSSASSQSTLSSDKKSERKESSSLSSDQDCLDLGVSMTDSSFGDISSVLKFESEPTSVEKKQNIYSETKVTTRSSSVSCRKSCDGPPGSVLGTILEAPSNGQPAKSGTDLTKSVDAVITQEGEQVDERRGNKQNINSEGETLVLTTTRRRRSLSTSGKESLVGRASSEPFKSQRGYSVDRDLTPVLETKHFKSTSFDDDKGSKPTVTHVAALLKKNERKIKESNLFSNRSKFVENEDVISPGKSITKRRRSSSVSSHDNQFLPANLEESPQKKRKTSSVQGDFAPVLKVSKVTKVTVAQSGKEESAPGTSWRMGTLRSRRALVESENKLDKSTLKQRRRSTSQSEVSEAHTAMTDNSLQRDDKTKRRSSSSDITPFNLSLRRRRSGASGFGSLLEPVAEGPEPLEDSSTEPVSAQSRRQAVEMYATARRLTRHQRALMQRSMDLSRPLQAGRYRIVNRQTSGVCKYGQELLILSKFPHRESSSSSPVSSLRLDHDDPSSHFDDVTDDDDTSSVKTRSSARRPSLCLSQVSTVKVPTVVNQESTGSTHREVSTARSLRSGKVYATSGSETSSDGKLLRPSFSNCTLPKGLEKDPKGSREDKLYNSFTVTKWTLAVSTVRIESAPSRLASSPSSIASERTVQMRRRSLRKAKDSLSAHATPTKNSGPSESGESTKDSPPKDRKTLHTRKALSMELHTIQEKSKEDSFDSSDKQTGSRAPQEGLLSPVAGPSTLRSATTKTPLFARRRSKNKSRSQPQLSEETPSTEAGPSRRQTTKKTKTPKHRKSKSRSLRSCASSQESPPAFRMGRNRLTVFQLRRFSKKKTTQEK
uniref:(California timema) hypothetical protein n=1 Tax=Timema californicum TaxID=61474 RepID=A0A7R9P8V2_TIMCA|nr:unnamed protein product [Timema californicum]